MRRTIPEQLTRGTFTVGEAALAGVSWRQLQSSRWRRLGAGYYVLARRDDSPLPLLEAIWRRMGRPAAFSGPTAGWLHGLDLPPCSPIEITVAEGAGVSTRAGVLVRRAQLDPEDIVDVGGLPVTSAFRTTVDLGSVADPVRSVIAVDMALHAGLARMEELDQHVLKRPGRKGTGRLRRALALAEPATESPMETRLRLIILRARLPRPEAQVTILGAAGEFIARPDFLYREQRLAIEFDGGVHRDHLTEDDRRQNRLANAGYRILRFTGADVLGTPAAVAGQIRAALGLRTAKRAHRAA